MFSPFLSLGGIPAFGAQEHPFFWEIILPDKNFDLISNDSTAVGYSVFCHVDLYFSFYHNLFLVILVSFFLIKKPTGKTLERDINFQLANFPGYVPFNQGSPTHTRRCAGQRDFHPLSAFPCTTRTSVCLTISQRFSFSGMGYSMRS